MEEKTKYKRTYDTYSVSDGIQYKAEYNEWIIWYLRKVTLFGVRLFSYWSRVISFKNPYDADEFVKQYPNVEVYFVKIKKENNRLTKYYD